LLFDQKINNLKLSNKHIGEVGQQVDIEGWVTKSNPFKSWYGNKYVNEITDEQGNVYVYFSSKSLILRSKVKLIAKIKSHDFYMGIKQNIISDCKILKIKTFNKGESDELAESDTNILSGH
jgi:hypothetical protein